METMYVSRILKDLSSAENSGLDISGYASFSDKCAHAVRITTRFAIIPLLNGFARDYIPYDVRRFLLSKCMDFFAEKYLLSKDQATDALREYVIDRLAYKVIVEPVFYSLLSNETLNEKIKRTSAKYEQYKNSLEKYYPQLFRERAI